MTFTPSGFTPGGGLDEEFQRQLDLQKDDVSSEQEFEDAQQGLRDANDFFQGLLSVAGEFTQELDNLFGISETQFGKNYQTVKQIPKYSSGNIVQTSGGTLYRPDPGTMSSIFMSTNDANITPKGEGDPTGYRSQAQFGGTVYEALSTANQKLFKKYNFTDDDAVFIMDNFDNLTRNFEAGVAGGQYSQKDFNKATKEMLPAFLKEWSGLNLPKEKLRPQLDHIAQLATTLPAYANAKLKDFPKITKIFVKNGIFGGHDPRNFQYLPAKIHTLKTNYFNDLMGKDGKKFWSQHDLTTTEGLEAGVREYSAIIANSHQIILDAKKAYKAMYKKDIGVDEMTDLLYGIINPYQKYTLKDMKSAIREVVRSRVKGAVEGEQALKRSITFNETAAEAFKNLGFGTKKLPKLPSIAELQREALERQTYQPLLTDPSTGLPYQGFLQLGEIRKNKPITEKTIDRILKELGFD